MQFPPYPDEMGARVQRNVCAACWREYMRRQTMVINEYRLDLMDPKAQDVLTRDMLEFLRLEAPGEEARAEGGAPSERGGSDGRERSSV